MSASATGYYNFGAHWRGGLNPYRLGADSAFQSGFTSGLSTPVSGNGDGSLFASYGIARDSSGNIYVSDANHRISKYNSSGVFQGWIGKIATSPSGGAAGCAGAAVGTFTPGWCTGGTSTSGSGDGMLSTPMGIALDSSGYLYVADNGNNRISKYNVTSGAFLGWIGQIATSPTGGAAGCAGAAGGTVTPGWCTGGTSKSGDIGDGSMDQPEALAFDTSGNIYVADGHNNRVDKYNSSGVFQGWIGIVYFTPPTGGAAGCTSATFRQFTPGWCVGGNSDYTDTNGGMYHPGGIALDSLGNIYVSSAFNNYTTKYDSSGTYQGWIGAVDSTPTGGASGCTSAPRYSLTPGWCLGGRPDTGVSTIGPKQPWGLAVDSSNNLYVADLNQHRIMKYDSSGVFQGWIGKVGTTPTGGATGCTSAAVGTFTPGWCTGGASTSGNGDGMFNSPRAITVDGSGNLYVADQGNSRIGKYSSTGSFTGALQSVATYFSWHRSTSLTVSGSGDGMLSSPSGVARDSAGNIYAVDAGNSRINKYNSSGVFQGWIGKIATSPTGGAAGCAGAAVNTVTPGWCKGGTSKASTVADGSLNSPRFIALDSSGNLYVGDMANSRINKFNSSGAFQGWIGGVNATPTGGDPGCSTAVAFDPTPGWCIGGTTMNDVGDGVLHGIGGIAIDSSGNLYIADVFNNRIVKYNASGIFQGWIGEIAVVPTGGAAGCTSASIGAFTPGWCKGGQSGSGTGDGMLNSPGGVALDPAGNLYVVDTNHHRISKYSASSGAFLGWIGKIGTSPTGGATGCNGAAVGTFTPGWCTGGTSTSGAGDGMLNNAYGIAWDTSLNIYVADRNNSRISKYNASSGAFLGWIGKIGSSPTGGATGCIGAAVGALTPGWCKGGAAASGADDGAMNGPQSIALDPSGNLYVTDLNNSKVIRFSIQGR
ncbi:MAG: hypothetical protein ACJ763_06075 [Bdellovibrionia bacterium]